MRQGLIAMGPAHSILVWVGAAPCHSVQGLRRCVLVLRSGTQQAVRQTGCEWCAFVMFVVLAGAAAAAQAVEK